MFAQIVGGTLRTLQIVPDGPVDEPKKGSKGASEDERRAMRRRRAAQQA